MTAPSPTPKSQADAWLEILPSEEESIEAYVAPFRTMSPAERLAVQGDLVRALLAIAGEQPILHDEDVDPLWPRWKDPTLGGRSR